MSQREIVNLFLFTIFPSHSTLVYIMVSEYLLQIHFPSSLYALTSKLELGEFLVLFPVE